MIYDRRRRRRERWKCLCKTCYPTQRDPFLLPVQSVLCTLILSESLSPLGMCYIQCWLNANPGVASIQFTLPACYTLVHSITKQTIDNDAACTPVPELHSSILYPTEDMRSKLVVQQNIPLKHQVGCPNCICNVIVLTNFSLVNSHTEMIVC